MATLRRRPAAHLTLLALAAGSLAAGTGAHASTPPSQAATVPAAGSSATAAWTGSIPPGANPAGDCSTAVTPETHVITLTVPPGTYDAATTKATFSITWANAGNDEILQLDGPGGLSRVSDTSAATETVEVIDPPAGEYTVTACGYAATSAQPYTGGLALTSSVKSAGATASLPSADAGGLAFSASVPSDPQRDVSEPLLEIDPSGRSYTCGPTGFSNASDYANTSDDGGDQFHLLGTQPRGQQGTGGGGDCGLGTGVTKNTAGNYQYAYAGLGPLTGFTTSTSPDNGRSIANAGPQGNTNTSKGGLADRQWLTFLDDRNVLLNYNQQQPRNVVVQKSTDGGLTYLPGADQIAAGSPDFPGPMRSMPASLLTPGATGRRAFFSWTSSDAEFSYVNLSVSDATGLGWRNCRVRRVPVGDGALQAFTVADADRDGNVYVVYADEKDFHTYLTSLPVSKVGQCDQTVSEGTAIAQATPPSKDPGWSTPLQVDRDQVRTTIFPWMVAGGAPGHVAISYYGTESDGDPNPGSFKASWDVYVDQTTNALDAAPRVGQVKATTHPVHYDSICLLGLGCDLSTPAGDRGLGDFFAIDLDPRTHKLQLVYNNTAKLPDAAAGSIAAPMVVTQTAGPSNDGGTVEPEAERATVRTSAADPPDDALLDYSRLGVGVTAASGAQTEVPALDLRDEQIGPEVDPATGARVPDGGFSVTIKVADLRDAALQAAIIPPSSQSLVYAFRFVNGFQPAAAVATWSPTGGFRFGFDDYTTGSAECGSPSGPKCEIYPGATAIKGRVDQAAGTIVLSVPRALLTPLKGSTGPGQRPTEKAPGEAVPGDRFYDATTFSFANPSPDPATQTFMVNADNVRAADFLLPGAADGAPGSPGAGAPGAGGGSGTPGGSAAGGGTGTAGGGGGSVPASCVAGGGFTSAGVASPGRSVRFAFARKISAKATVSVFQQSSGRTITGERLVARFTGKSRSFTWNGKANQSKRRVVDGFYFVRYSIGSGASKDIRRVVLERRRGRFVKRSDFYRRATCDALPSFKLERPVFGGRANRPLGISFRVAEASRVTVTVSRGGRTIRTFGPTTRRATVTHRLSLASRKLARGNYTVRITVAASGGRTLTTSLVGRRL